MHYRARWLWEHSRGERQRNMAASIRCLAREKKVQEERGNGSWGVGGLPRTFKRAVRGGWSMKDPLGQSYTRASLCVCACVSVCWGKTCSHANVRGTCTPGGLSTVSVHRFKDQSWSSSAQKIGCFQRFILSVKWNRELKLHREANNKRQTTQPQNKEVKLENLHRPDAEDNSEKPNNRVIN